VHAGNPFLAIAPGTLESALVMPRARHDRRSMTADALLLAGSLSLTGRYAPQGRLAAAGLHQAVQDVRNRGGVRIAHRYVAPDVVILDDGSTREGVRRSLDRLSRADLLVGPYGSDLVAEAARWAADRGRTLWNHGGNADDVQRLPGVMSVGTPASRYLPPVLDAVTSELPGARVMVAVGRGAFGRSVADGAREAAERFGMRIVGIMTHREVPEVPNADVLLMAGTFAEDLELVRRLRARPLAIGAVAAGLGLFGVELGRIAEGVLGPSQWEEGLRFPIDVGPPQAEVVRSLRARVLATLRAGAGTGHVEYPTAQAYAAGLLAMHCVQEAASVDDDALLATARRLRCTTFFGAFGLDADGRQKAHEMLVVQWQQGVKAVVWPPRAAEASTVI
jgi:branched-chain amino acid transport system substrate-binding protein